MQALYTVTGGPVTTSLSAPPTKTRTYYVQSEEILWDYAPIGSNLCDRTPFNAKDNVFVKSHLPIKLAGNATGYTIGSTYLKAVYVQYTDDTYTTKVAPAIDHLGVMGPILRARVGEVMEVRFRNKLTKDRVSMHPHGVFYLKSSEGAPYNDGTSGADKLDDSLAPGASHTYRWEVPETAGPGPGERGGTKLWMYHSHNDEASDSYAGLFGAILIVGKDTPKYSDSDLTPTDGTKEVVLHFSVSDEGSSFFATQNARRDPDNNALSAKRFGELLKNEQFVESNLMHGINGHVYCNSPLIKLTVGQRARFYYYSLGSEVDLHTPMLGNEVFQLDTKSTRVGDKLLGGTFASSDLIPVTAGIQELKCNILDHVAAGMRALFDISPSSDKSSAAATVDLKAEAAKADDVFIAAEEIEWDYTPASGGTKDLCTGNDFGEDEEVFTLAGDDRCGSKAIKAVYREYEDATFSKKASPNSSRQTPFSGLSGPLLHFEVGDVVRIVFRNKLSFSANLNIAGLELLDGNDLAVKPGAISSYLLRVPVTAAPGPLDLSSVPMIYYSSVNPGAHTAAGLVGVIGITGKGGLDPESRLPKNTSLALPLAFQIFRENDSPLIARTLQKYASNGPKINDARIKVLQKDDEFVESNAMHSANGYQYCNNPVLKIPLGSTVRFYLFGFGSEESMHTPYDLNPVDSSLFQFSVSY
jgi:hephaestin